MRGHRRLGGQRCGSRSPRPALTKTATLSQRVLGADARATLTARYNLGLAYYDAGRVQEAITRFEQLLPDLMRVLGAEAPVTLHAQAALAKGYRAVGRHEDAARLLSVRA